MHALPKKLTPKGLALPIEKDQRVHDELTGDPERQLSSPDFSGIDHARETERSISDRHGLADDDVVHYLAVAEERDSIGAMIVPNGEANNQRPVAQLQVGFICRDEGGLVDRDDLVRGQAAYDLKRQDDRRSVAL